MTTGADGGSLTTRLESLKSTIEQGRTEKARAEATLEALSKQQSELEAECAELGVELDGLDAEIERVRTEAAAKLAEAADLLSPPGGQPL